MGLRLLSSKVLPPLIGLVEIDLTKAMGLRQLFARFMLDEATNGWK